MLASFRVVFGCLLAVAAAGLLAVVTAEPMLFPSLGPTIIMLLDSPGWPATAPRNIVLAHGAGLITGWLSLAIFGLLSAPWPWPWAWIGHAPAPLPYPSRVPPC